ncbi:hypothetical protein N7474_010768 [Penicillium riverlandense]|uniref:uncharacterized protein n=1 Tax=Penicillium riverlandense TaxID=1903569 RepID=UPI00254733CF|nr:uncharacterized protein N7474_010768 [Penicillium riverlandense]KAJ5804881.1 hypothetical protein N7474_010768 [Penicillium riverlandense]
MTRVFLTGASGYIGGDILHVLASAHPEYECSVLVRDSDKAAAISKAYPDVRTVLGDLDSASLIEEEAAQADVVINAASNKHIESAKAIALGLARRIGSRPGYWIQISGATVLTIPDIINKSFGEGREQIVSDIDDADEIREIVRQNADRRMLDNFILNEVKGPKTALIFGPMIYGQARGPVNRRSVQVPELARVTLQNRGAVQVGKGESTWSNIHIFDLTDIVVRLVEKAVKGEDNGLWNQDGLYFTSNDKENDLLSFAKVSQLVAQAAHNLGLADSASVKSISYDEAEKLSDHSGILWGTNAQQRSQRALQLLGWAPKADSLEKDISAIVRAEAVRLGLL